jgi:predicted enzyme related to lactoylglutathione lyase
MKIARLAFIVSTVAALGGCASHSNTAPVAAAPGRSVLAGKFVWHDLVTEKPEECRRFYGSLLGWEFDDIQRLGRPYALARLGARRVAGMLSVQPGGEKRSQWVAYVSVPDVDKAVAEAVKGGARTLVAARDVENVARAAVVADPQGAALGFARLHAGDPADEASPQEGRFFWMEYFARDPEAALSFYTTLFGYRSEETERVAGLAYHVLRAERPRAGVLQVPRAEMRPAWLPYVMVKDPAALAARVESLGGTVLFTPRADVRKGTLAIVADPSGAPIALQKWPI